MYIRNRWFSGFGLSDQKWENLSETVFQRGFSLLCPFLFGLFERKTRLEPTGWAICSRVVFTPPSPGRGEWGRFGRAQFTLGTKRKKTAKSCLHRFERKTRVCPSALHSVYQAIAFAHYYTPNSRDTWVVSRCRSRVRLLPYKLQNYSCLRQIYE